MPQANLPARKPLIPPWLLALLVVLAGTLVVLAATGVFSRPQTALQAPAEALPTPTPTPVRALSAIASQSAFLALEAAVASLSANIQALPPQDPSLSPPVLDLELGFGE
jgi:hypothetical protein